MTDTPLSKKERLFLYFVLLAIKFLKPMDEESTEIIKRINHHLYVS